jgi:hypothetical protein
MRALGIVTWNEKSADDSDCVRAGIRERRLTAVFAIATAVAAIWSIYKYQTVYHALINSFALEFQDPLNSRYAFPEFALSPSTPLALQAEYVKSMAGGCFSMLCFSLSFFSFGQVIGGWLGLGAFLLIAASTIKSWKIYKANCNRTVVRDDKGEP